MLESVLSHYKIQSPYTIVPFGNGLINHTWKVSAGEAAYMLQKINHQVFIKPQAIADNISVIGNYLSTRHPDYVFPMPMATTNGETLVHLFDDGYYRLTPFVKNANSFDVVTSAKQAYEAAKAFGTFTHLLSRFEVSQLQITLQDFHNLALRYQQFQQAVREGNTERIRQCMELIQELQSQQHLVEAFQNICTSPQFKTRVTHHDTKISNVLFDDAHNSICVIDLDTVMPGLFISDVGDMMRTYLSPVSEEAKDLSQIEVREDYFKAIIEGYLHHMHTELTPTEKEHFVYAGKFMIYMQALRFLTDYLNNDVYYGAAYPEQNLVRAQNQACLLQQLTNKEESLQALVIETLEHYQTINAL